MSESKLKQYILARQSRRSSITSASSDEEISPPLPPKFRARFSTHPQHLLESAELGNNSADDEDSDNEHTLTGFGNISPSDAYYIQSSQSMASSSESDQDTPHENPSWPILSSAVKSSRIRRPPMPKRRSVTERSFSRYEDDVNMSPRKSNSLWSASHGSSPTAKRDFAALLEGFRSSPDSFYREGRDDVCDGF